MRAGAVVPARLAADGYAQTAEHLARLARLSVSANGAGEAGPRLPRCRCPAGRSRSSPARTSISTPRERKREARATELENEIERSERKLANDGFVTKARPEIVQAERDKLERLRRERDAL